MPLMTQREYAKRAGVTPQYINKLVAQGKIRKIGRKVDSRQADQVIAAWKRAGRVIPAKRRAPVATKRKVSIVAAESTVKGPRESATKSLTAARAQREHYQAEIAKLDYERMSGNLLPRDQVLEAERRKNANIRTSFRRLARSLAPVLARTNAEAEVEQIALREIDRILGQLAIDPLGSVEIPLMPAELVAPPEAQGAQA